MSPMPRSNWWTCRCFPRAPGSRFWRGPSRRPRPCRRWGPRRPRRLQRRRFQHWSPRLWRLPRRLWRLPRRLWRLFRRPRRPWPPRRSCRPRPWRWCLRPPPSGLSSPRPLCRPWRRRGHPPPRGHRQRPPGRRPPRQRRCRFRHSWWVPGRYPGPVWARPTRWCWWPLVARRPIRGVWPAAPCQTAWACRGVRVLRGSR